MSKSNGLYMDELQKAHDRIEELAYTLETVRQLALSLHTAVCTNAKGRDENREFKNAIVKNIDNVLERIV